MIGNMSVQLQGPGTYSAAEIFDQECRALELRRAGYAHREIAEELGTSIATATTRLKAGYARVIIPTATELVTEEIDRLDKIIARCERIIEREDTPNEDGVMPAPDPKWAAMLMRAAESRRKLMGIDAAVKQDITVTEVTQEDIAMESLIREAKMRASTEGPITSTLSASDLVEADQ